jgi:membrane-associated protease RseP (regulator of RpoE activity)
MHRQILLGGFALFAVVLVVPAWGQGALDQLEERLRQAVPGVIVPGDGSGPIDNTLPPPPDLPPGANAADQVQIPGYLGIVVEEPEAGAAGPGVTTVRQGSPAAAAGLRVGDQVLSIDGKPTTTLDDIDLALGAAVAGQTLKIIVVREGKQVTLSPKLKSRLGGGDVDPAAVPKVPAPTAPAIMGRASLGVSVANLTAATQRQFGIPVTRGALITAVNPGGAGDQAGLPIGGTIVAIDGIVVDSADAVVAKIKESKPGQEVELTYYNGDKLNRKSVRLAAMADTVAAPAPGVNIEVDVPPPPRPGVGVIPGGDRPILNALERVIEGATNGQGPIVIPGVARGNPPVANAPDQAAEIAELRAQARLLQEQLDRMERLVKELEARRQ